MKKRKNKSRLSEFIRYTRGEMTKREENAFQRELQRDPFAEEAEEGLSEISPEGAVSDLNILERRLKTRVSGSQRKMYYSIAASVAVLMIISSVFIIINKSKPASELSGTVAVKAPVEVPVSELITEQPATETRDFITEPEKRAVVTPEPAGEEPQIAAGDVKSENAVLPAAQEPSLYEVEEQVSAAPRAALKKTNLSEVRGTVFSSEDNLPVPGAMISLKGTNTRVITDTEGKFRIPVVDTVNQTLVADFIGMESMEVRAKEDTDMKISLTPTAMALSEVVVVGYGAKSSKGIEADTAANEEAVYSSAQPADGRNNFDIYIEENIKNPASLPSGQKVVVVLSFTVRSTGIIDNIKVIRSPGPEFSDEAIRLIREGPSWKPAEENSRPVDDDVKIRFVFYKNIEGEHLPE